MPSVAILFDSLIIFLVVSLICSSRLDVLLIRRWGESGVIYGQSFWSVLQAWAGKVYLISQQILDEESSSRVFI